MWRGGELRGAQVAYETWGELDRTRSNAVLLFTGLSPPAHAASSRADPSEGWWEQMIGPGRAIDTDRWFLICINSLGSCFGSTGPASIDPLTGTPYRLRFPDLSLEDIARGGFEVLRTLGIERADAVIGPSLGGMIVLAFAAQFPRAARRLVTISGTSAASPFAIALRSIQREAIASDPAWRDGDYEPAAPPVAGLRIARKLGTVTYRSAGEWRERFDRAPFLATPGLRHVPFAADFAVQSYLEVQAERFVRVFDANCYLYLSRAMDRFDLSQHRGSVRAALEPSGIEHALVIGVESDMLFPVHEQRALAEEFEAARIRTRFVPLPSIAGHDSFLVDIPRFDAPIRSFLSRHG
ncbi:MAG: homoserine O-acetyltransferase MetX [Gammaproteobacteria bacterium]